MRDHVKDIVETGYSSSSPSPQATRGKKALLAEGEDGLYSQCWYAIGWSKDVPRGGVKRFNIFDGHVAAFRTQDGDISVVSPFCRHYGSDLTAGGKVVDNTLRCPYHHWCYDQNGQCVSTSSDAPVPRQAALFNFPAVEHAGLIWIFNGSTPLYDPPHIGMNDDDVDIYTFEGETLNVPPALIQLNFFDYQHTKFVHNWALPVKPKPHFEKYIAKIEPLDLIDPSDGGPQVVGFTCHGLSTTVFTVERELKDGKRFSAAEISAFIPTGDGNTRTLYVMAISKDENRSADETQEMLRKLTDHKIKTQNEDMEILRNISYRFDLPTKYDDQVVQYLKFAQNFPRAHPSADFIK